MWKFLVSIACYLLGLTSIAYFFWFIQFKIDTELEPFSYNAVLQNFGLFLLFPLQHSVLARARPKQMLQNIFTPQLARSVYVGTSGLVMWPILIFWRRLEPVLYSATNALIFDVMFYVALVLIIFSTVALNHAAMFGLKQGYSAWKRGKINDEERLITRGIYGIVRHPITSLLIVALWSHETLSTGRLIFNLLFTSYALIGTYFEERSLVSTFGEEYHAYARRVPAFIPRLKR